jgi:uncharacterized protein YutE (UPF0331/DUF86 family)
MYDLSGCRNILVRRNEASGTERVYESREEDDGCV